MNHWTLCSAHLFRHTIAFGQIGRLLLILSLLASPTALFSQTAAEPVPEVRVFILAGQSNMTGHGVVDLDHAEHYNGGKGTLVQVMNDPANRDRMAHLKESDGTWRTRDDVFVWYRTETELKTGGLSIGYTGYGGEPHHIGPELQFGHVVGDAVKEPVLIIKTAWGGKSLYKDFRPPSSGGTLGPYYRLMLEQIAEAMDHAGDDIPSLKGKRLKLSGLVWQQGWNDMVDDVATAEYTTNLVNLITDLRKQFLEPELPVIVGELGNGGKDAGENMKRFRKAQAAIVRQGLSNVGFVKTAAFARPAEASPNTGHGHHWFGNAESYFLVGDALGRSMIHYLPDLTARPRVLILGDSISIGYTPFVRENLKTEADVFRPMFHQTAAENCAGTDHGVANIDRWLRNYGGQWDVIHVNFGLHDLKHVHPETGKNSNDPNHPLQSNPAEYEKQLKQIVTKLKKTGAQLVLCTTTPVPEGVRPLRETTAPAVYNEIVTRIAKENGIEVDDLYTFANERLSEIQQPANVHFSRQGSKVLAGQVTNTVRKAMERSAKTPR